MKLHVSLRGQVKVLIQVFVDAFDDVERRESLVTVGREELENLAFAFVAVMNVILDSWKRVLKKNKKAIIKAGTKTIQLG